MSGDTSTEGLTVGDLIEKLQLYEADLPVLQSLDTWPDHYVKSVTKRDYERDAVTDEEHIILSPKDEV